MIRRLRAQSTVEYAVFIIIIAGVFIAMQQYIKRGFQGRMKATMDDFGDQYDPRLSNGLSTSSMEANSQTQVRVVPSTSGGRAGHYTLREDDTHSVETKQSHITVGTFDENGNPAQQTQ